MDELSGLPQISKKMHSKKKILVIGGGFGGIICIKCLKEEGFEPVCYEKSANLGGTWFYREEFSMGMPSIMPTTSINHSKEMGTLSNYVTDKSFPNYMRHHEVIKMYNDIGQKFDCFRHITCNREVLKVKRSADYDETGRWDVDVKNTETGETNHEGYDGVLVSVGHITYPKMATFPDMEKFQGEIIHTHSLKRPDKFKGKKVVVIGAGCSGVDAAVDISSEASQVYLSARTGIWLFPRIGPNGMPFDFCMLRRFGTYMQQYLGYKFSSWFLEKYYVNTRFHHNLYNLRPEYPALSKDPVVNDILPAKIITGSVVMKRKVKCFTEKGVIFENETKVTDVDVVIMATGYTWKFPFLEEGIVKTEGNRIDLYKCMFPPHLKHPSLAIIGFILPFGPIFPLMEVQCRWAAQVFNGKFLPPGEEEMMADIIKRYKENSKRYAPSDKMSIRVDYVQYLDEMASQFGAKPNMWKYLFTDLALFKSLIFGPSLPYQYRLEGPHKWDGARGAILTTYKRVRFPFTGVEYKKEKKPVNLSTGVLLKYLMIFLVMAFWLSQKEITLKYFILAILLPYVITWKGFYKKYFAALFLLPFYISWDGFVLSYFLTLFFPLIIANLT